MILLARVNWINCRRYSLNKGSFKIRKCKYLFYIFRNFVTQRKL